MKKPVQHEDESNEVYRRRIIQWMNQNQFFSHPYPEIPLKKNKK